jgi:hypothetical protein
MLLAACSHDGRYGEDQGNLFEAGLALTPENHPGGNIEGQCLLCHPIENIHLVPAAELPEGVDMNAIQKMVTEQGAESCSHCHPINLSEETALP